MKTKKPPLLDLGVKVWLAHRRLPCDVCNHRALDRAQCPACYGDGLISVRDIHRVEVAGLLENSWVTLKGEPDNWHVSVIFPTRRAAEEEQSPIWRRPPQPPLWTVQRARVTRKCTACGGIGKLCSNLLRTTYTCPICRGDKTQSAYTGKWEAAPCDEVQTYRRGRKRIYLTSHGEETYSTAAAAQAAADKQNCREETCNDQNTQS